MNTIIKYFNLNNNYSLDDLNKAYKYKIEILKNLDINNLDKKILIKEYTKKYNLGIELLNKQLSIYPTDTYLNTNKHLTILNDFFDFNSSLLKTNDNFKNDDFKNKFMYKSYNERLLPDGSKIIKESKEDNINGKIKTIYKIMPNGEKIILKEK
jgi:hypothetical protein